VKLTRSLLVSLAVAALLSGCGNSSSPTNVTPSLDTAPPPTPTGMILSAEGSEYTLRWSASSAPDIAGYEIYQYMPSPDRDNSYVMIASTVGAGTSFELPASVVADDQFLRVAAVDAAGNTSGLSSPVHVMVDLQDGSGLPAGFDPTEPMKRN